MRIRSKALSILWKAAIAACAFVGLGLQIGLFKGELHLSSFKYFTNISNLLCMAYFLIDVIFLLAVRGRDGSVGWCPALKGVAMMGITVTWLVAHFMLGSFTMGASLRVSVRLVHYVVPIMTILDWLLFDKKGQIKLTAPLLWTTFPLAYFTAIMGLAYFGKGVPFYPYPFMNVEKQGLPRVLITVVLMLVFFVALGYLFVLVDRLLQKAEGKRIKNPASTPPV
jgi:hypothetical protein